MQTTFNKDFISASAVDLTVCGQQLPGIYSANVLFIIQNKFLQKDTKLVLAKALKISMAMHTKDHYSMNERAPMVTA